MQKVSKYKIADSYANAWVDASFGLKKEEIVYKEVVLLNKSLKKDAGLWQQIMSPIGVDSQKIDIIKSIAKKIKLSDISANTLLLMAENKRLDCLLLVLDVWQKKYYEKKSILEVDVETVIPLSATQNKKLLKVLEEKLNQQVKINYIINEDILGGLKISYNSFTIDDTIKNKLEIIKKKMLQG